MSYSAPTSTTLVPFQDFFERALIAIVLFLLSSIFWATVGFAQSTEATSSDSARGSYEGAIETVYPDWFKLSFLELEEDIAEAAEAGKRLMLLFHQDGCPYCNAFVEKNLAQKDIVDTLQNKFDVVELNMWGDRELISVNGQPYTEKAFAEALNVQFTPTVLFLTEEGGLSLRINGYRNPDEFRVALDYVTQKLEKSQSFNEFVSKQEGQVSSKTLPTRDYLTGPITELASRDGKGSKPVILFFEQGSCRNCEVLHDTVLAKPDSQELLSDFDVFQVNIWGRDEFQKPSGDTTTGRQWSQELGIDYAPTLILYSSDGEEVLRSEAWFKTFHTQSILDYVSSEAWRDESNFQRYISARAEALRESGVDVDIWD